MKNIKCPYCDKVITKIMVENMDLENSGGRTYPGAVYACPYCRKLISVGYDPLIQSKLIAEQIARLLRGSMR